MTLGRTLWLIILVKLFIMFFILRLFFFPRFLNTPVVGDDKEGYVSNELIHRRATKHGDTELVFPCPYKFSVSLCSYPIT